MFNNDERYWDIHKLNKWFAISSILFLVSMAWTFIDDNDDEFKIYQREFRKMEIEISEKNLQEELELVTRKESIEHGLKYTGLLILNMLLIQKAIQMQNL